MATTIIGFVTQAFAGRAGLFEATLSPVNGGSAVRVQVSDLDGEPERFNERLTKVRLFSEALTCGEPVQVTYVPGEAGGYEVEDVRRLARNPVHPAAGVPESAFVGFVSELIVEESRAVAGPGTPEAVKRADVVRVGLLDPVSGASQSANLVLQGPIGDASRAMLDVLRSAQAAGEPVSVRIRGSNVAPDYSSWIMQVDQVPIRGKETVVDGFVESIGVQSAHGHPFASVMLSTAPAFTSDRILDPSPFTPLPVRFLTPLGAATLRLLETALGSGQRVRVAVIPSERRGGEGDTHIAATHTSVAGNVGLLLASRVQLLAPLASASRPVWVRVRQESLSGPPVAECKFPSPISDLSTHGVASLQVPHRAAWEGVGCFNGGVYRIQVTSPVRPTLFLDGKELGCTLELPVPSDPSVEEEAAEAVPALAYVGARIRTADANTDGGTASAARTRGVSHVYSAHACLCHCHTLRVEFAEWRCGYRFQLDVFKVV